MNKSELKRLALELRAEIGLTAHVPFDPYQLAQLYGVDVHRLSELDCSSAALQHFGQLRSHVFSGALVPLTTGGAVMIENDSHPIERRRSTASHEMAHLALEHEFAASLTDDTGRCQLARPEQEKEAAELGGELLLPADAARRLALQGASDEAAAEQFHVSIELARWRMNVSGARKIAARSRGVKVR